MHPLPYPSAAARMRPPHALAETAAVAVALAYAIGALVFAAGVVVIETAQEPDAIWYALASALAAVLASVLDVIAIAFGSIAAASGWARRLRRATVVGSVAAALGVVGLVGVLILALQAAVLVLPALKAID